MIINWLEKMGFKKEEEDMKNPFLTSYKQRVSSILLEHIYK